MRALAIGFFDTGDLMFRHINSFVMGISTHVRNYKAEIMGGYVLWGPM
jgi:hypothetical protein